MVGLGADVKTCLGYYLSGAKRGKAQEGHYGLCICSESIEESQLRVESCDCHGWVSLLGYARRVLSDRVELQNTSGYIDEIWFAIKGSHAGNN